MWGVKCRGAATERRGVRWPRRWASAGDPDLGCLYGSTGPAAAITEGRPLAVSSGQAWQQRLARTAEGGLRLDDRGPKGEWSLTLDADAARSLELPGTCLAWRRVMGDLTPQRLVLIDSANRIVATVGWQLDFSTAATSSEEDAFEVAGWLELQRPDGSSLSDEQCNRLGAVRIQVRWLEL